MYAVVEGDVKRRRLGWHGHVNVFQSQHYHIDVKECPYGPKSNTYPLRRPCHTPLLFPDYEAPLFAWRTRSISQGG